MKKVILLLFVCLFVFCGCAKEDVNAEKEQEKVEGEISPEPEVEEEPEEPEVEEASPFGLTDKEIECILKVLKEKNIPVDSIDDIYDISYIGYRKIYTDSGIEYDYSIKEYGVTVKNGPACNLLIPVEDLE